MNHRVVITAAAHDDARAIVRWITDHSLEKATRWFFDFLAAANSLRNFPARCPLARESSDEVEVRQLLFGGHRILFSIEGNTVLVLHVRHQKQRPLLPDEL
jgi:plasmid stabilization system protein ParE